MSDTGVCKIKAEFIQAATTSINTNSGNGATALVSKRKPDEEERADNKCKHKKVRGQNKARGPTFKSVKSKELCHALILTGAGEELPKCQREDCDFLHDINKYLEEKPLDIGPLCYSYETFGNCPRGLTCRFGASHIINARNQTVIPNTDNNLTVESVTKNHLTYDIQKSLRKRTYNFKVADEIIRWNDNKNAQKSGTILNTDVIPLGVREKHHNTIDWRNKLILSPLTTVGNLPFRRICKEYGADVTCGEMAMCSALLQGSTQEWALLRRHHTEDIFGVQLCAQNPYLFTKCGQLLSEHCQLDFVDVNLGCPLDFVYKSGAGSGLLLRARILELSLRNLNAVLNVPLTVKTRMGVYSKEPIAHNLAPKFRDWGVSLLTVHGRSREQRYTRNADWNYIGKVVEAAHPMLVVGNGDILSIEDWQEALRTHPQMTTAMIGRGALIKPWLFREIRDEMVWDISSSERFTVLKRFVNYGLEHWGCDSKGVETTRRFLLEWLSFLYRYIPVGLLEQPPQRINQRPPRYIGRDDLETLMASSSASDWIRISEMLLGRIPEGFQFVPKHKANSYSA